MKDPYIPFTISKKVGTDLFNKLNADIVAEFGKATSQLQLQEQTSSVQLLKHRHR